MSAIELDAIPGRGAIGARLRSWVDGAAFRLRNVRDEHRKARPEPLPRAVMVGSAGCGGSAEAPACRSPAAAASGAIPCPTQHSCSLALELSAAQRRGREMERALAQYVSPRVLDRLMADPDGLSLGGDVRDVTVLFADVRGFTTLAEAMKADPNRLNRLMSAILSPLTEIVLAHGGVIDKYMGDCVMAFWGAPDDDPDHARHAFDAACAMLAALPDINRLLKTIFGDVSLPDIEIGVGVNSGACVVGNLGSHRRFDYSVLGDPVNVASRLEGLCKAYGVPLLVGEATAERLGLAAVRLVKIDCRAVRGREEPQGLFALA